MVVGSTESNVKDMSLQDFGRKELNIQEVEMPGLMQSREEFGPQKPFKGVKIQGSLHMTVQTQVLIETLQELGQEIRWCSCNVFSTQDHQQAQIAKQKTQTVFQWKGETLSEYWDCTEQTLSWPDGSGPDLIVDDGGDQTLLIHEGVKQEQEHEKDPSYLPDPQTTTNLEYKQVLRIIRNELQTGDKKKYTKMQQGCKGVSEETTTGVHRLYQRQKEGNLLFPQINVNDCVTKSKFDNLYGCKHSLPDGIMRQTDVMIQGKITLICGYGDVGKGCQQQMKGCGQRVLVSEVDPICQLQQSMEGFQVCTIETQIKLGCDIYITTTGNFNIITQEHMSKMKNNQIVGNIGHFDNEIDMEGVEKWPGVKCENIKQQVDRFVFPADNHGVIILQSGRLLNLGCQTGHPSWVMSCSFTNQTLQQLDLLDNWKGSDILKRGKREKYENQVYLLPKVLDEKVQRLHLPSLGQELTELTKEQQEYIKVDQNGPYKPDTYRY